MVEKGVHIDLFFRNGLKEFEVLPPPDVWNNIRPLIRRKQKQYTLLKVAAIGIVLLSLGIFSYLLSGNLSGKFSKLAVTLNQEVFPEGNYIARAVTEPVINHRNIPVLTSVIIKDKIDTGVSPGDIFTAVSGNELSSPPVIEGSLKYDMIKVPLIDISLNRPDIIGSRQLSGLQGLNKSNKSNYSGSRWGIGALASPTYYSGFDINRNNQSTNLTKYEKAAVSYSGGVAFSYNVNKRFSVQTGVYYSSFDQKVTGVSSFAGFQNYKDSKNGSEFGVQTSSGTITSSNNDIFLLDNNSGSRVLTHYTIDVFDPYKTDLQYIDNSILQNFNYIEIPFLLKYKIIDRKIDFNLLGGISYNLLVNNSAYSVSGGVKYFIGRTEGLKPVSLSSSVGMGMEYSLSAKISLNIEPTFHYYLTQVSGSARSSWRPYSFGILSGFSYKF